MRIRHISLDFWHTLAEPNPAYAEQRTQILSRHFGVSESAFRQTYKRLKNAWEEQAIRAGLVPGLEQVNWQLGELLGSHTPYSDFLRSVDQLNKAFKRYPPHLNVEVMRLLPQLARAGYTLSIGSNTNFIIRGTAVRAVLPDVFNFQIYSDQIGFCKPSPAFYAHVLVGAARCSSQVIEPGNILHVGDNLHCDGAGASGVGMQTQICSPGKPLFSILTSLENHRESSCC